MSEAAALMADLAGLGIELQAHGDALRFRPKDAMTPELIERVKACKADLLAILASDPRASLRRTIRKCEQRIAKWEKTEARRNQQLQAEPAPIEPVAETHADREWRRFLAASRPWPDGRGWYDPAQIGVINALAQVDVQRRA